MLIPCPLCGSRDMREFTYMGAATYLDRPAPGADPSEWDAFLHLRDNPAGPTEDLWYHARGCRAWIRVRRDTRDHDVSGATLVADGSLDAR